MDDVIITVVAVSVVLIFFLFRQGLGRKQSYRVPPGPTGLPIIGNLHQIKKANPHRFLYDLAKIYGPILSYKLGSQRVVVISSAELAKELLKTQDANFTNRPKHRGQEVTTYGRRDIAFSHYTAYYRDMRKMSINHLFSPTRVASFRRVREEEVQNLINKISEAAEKSQTINMNELLLSYSNSVICRIALGKKYEKVIERKRFIKILDDTQALWGTLFHSDVFPYFKFLDDVTGLSAWLKEAFKEQDDYLQELINEKLDSNLEKSETESLIDTLMDVYRNQPFSTEFTLENVKGGMLDIVIAGTEAAPAVTVWGMTYLMKNREIMKKAQQEIRNMVGNRGFVTEDDIPNLPYFKALVKETMRIEPVVALLIHRTCLEHSKIGGYDIPAGTAVHVNLWAVSRDEDAWGQDAHEFRPERFLEMKEIDYKGTDYEFTPFGSGRRMCPAMHLGVAMLEVVFANLLYKFNFELPDGMKPGDITLDVLAGVAMHKAQHLLLVPSKFI